MVFRSGSRDVTEAAGGGRSVGGTGPEGLGDLEADAGSPGVAVRDLVHRAAGRHAPRTRRVAEADGAREDPALVAGDLENLERLDRVEELEQRGQAAAYALRPGGQHGVPDGGIDRATGR